MFKNYFIMTLRNIRKHTLHSVINIVGFSIGMAVCLLIFLWVQDEFGYDRFHVNKDDISQVYCLSGLAALLIALLTVSYQAIKAARANPAESLHYE